MIGGPPPSSEGMYLNAKSESARKRGNKKAYVTGKPASVLGREQRNYLMLQAPGRHIAPALTRLFTCDSYLFEVDANERSISFRLAYYLQNRFPKWNVDCEYNRDGVDPKQLDGVDLYPQSNDDDAQTVFPDVIVHKRGTAQNYLAIELKKSTSSVSRTNDFAKLRGYKEYLGYTYALFLEVGTAQAACLTYMEWV